MKRAARWIYVTGFAVRMIFAYAIIPRTIRGRTMRFWMLEPSIADEVLEIGEIIRDYAEIEEKRREAAPFN